LRKRVPTKGWKKQEIEELRSLVDTMTNEELCQHYNVSIEVLAKTFRKYKIKRAEETVKARISQLKSGDSNPNWKGGISKDHARYLAIQRERYPEHKKARDAVYAALKKGILIKPERCEGCNIVKPLEGHHASYESDQWLDVEWLCKKCHRKKHPQH
jgi:hypothetical protein